MTDMSENTNNSSRLRLKTDVRNNDNVEYKFNIEFYVFMENSEYIAYCPSLDISTSGATFNEAVGNFHEMFQLHIECCLQSNTLHDDLTAHGWTLMKQSIKPPTFMALMKKPEMQKLMQGSIGFEKIVTPARIPAVV
jgi:predicted RNase H-like HicB family nuclease